jgi:hypothetical protein
MLETACLNIDRKPRPCVPALSCQAPLGLTAMLGAATCYSSLAYLKEPVMSRDCDFAGLSGGVPVEEPTQTIICGGRKWRWVMLLAANHGPSSLSASSSLPVHVRRFSATKLSRNAVFFNPCGSMHRILPCRVPRNRDTMT